MSPNVTIRVSKYTSAFKSCMHPGFSTYNQSSRLFSVQVRPSGPWNTNFVIALIAV